MDIPDNIPESGAVFAFGKSKFADNKAGCFWMKNDMITSISCGDEHTALVTEAGKLYVFGTNDWGQLGLGHTHPANKPTCLKTFKVHKATMVACGRNHTLVCTATNKLFAFGNNSDSQLGVDSLDSSNLPIQVNTENIGTIKQIGAGADFSAVLTTDGDVYAWGSNVEGQLGLGNETNEAIKPTLIKTLDASKYIACGYYHMAVVSNSGDLCTFGEDEYGKLGDREIDDTSVPSKIKLTDPVHVAKVACGGSHTAFVSQSGELYTMGDGSHGELGHGENLSQISKPRLVERLKGHNVIHVSCGENFTCAITKRGRIYTFGDGRHGKLALDEENFTNQFKPFRCTRFKDFDVKFAECGGCHMIVSATHGHGTDDMESEDEDPMMQTFVGGKTIENTSLTEIKLNGDVNATTLQTGEKIVNLSRTMSAREKRRKGRENQLSKTLPPLRTLKPFELIEAAKTLPKPMPPQQQNYSFSNEWSHVSKNKQPQDADLVSEISVFNKVHVLQQVGAVNTLTPVKRKLDVKKDDVKVSSKNEEKSLKKDKTETTEVIPLVNVKENGNSTPVQEIPSTSKGESDDDEEEDADDEDEITEEDDETEEEESGEDEEPQTSDNKDKTTTEKADDQNISSLQELDKMIETPDQEKLQKQKKGIFNIFKRDKKDKGPKDSNNEASVNSENTSASPKVKNKNTKSKNEIKTSDTKSKDEAPVPAAAPPTDEESPTNSPDPGTKINKETSSPTEQNQSGDEPISDNPVQPQTTDKITNGSDPTVPKAKKSKMCTIL